MPPTYDSSAWLGAAHPSSADRIRSAREKAIAEWPKRQNWQPPISLDTGFSRLRIGLLAVIYFSAFVAFLFALGAHDHSLNETFGVLKFFVLFGLLCVGQWLRTQIGLPDTEKWFATERALYNLTTLANPAVRCDQSGIFFAAAFEQPVKWQDVRSVDLIALPNLFGLGRVGRLRVRIAKGAAPRVKNSSFVTFSAVDTTATGWTGTAAMTIPLLPLKCDPAKLYATIQSHRAWAGPPAAQPHA